ncbi:MAG TPA: tRNA (adenosine(37)-N6)-threonylcarbamoyltransferase complex ATPase subunit type 1 TsaE [Aggregatilinea sp.]|uniref:tRNA (adenosine(37)-N6)-threonylcarbamoyltransferase complex ATPase subunit type 1 TsaE n=1 Tax=Aggregatilinea sp. TaxID=2806333 RepID=UPI002CAB7349|nr:tRNA (adenosine(37)-N6)-threonylcarbamoyltransferase complex ATPase subunit type 1 TsaE [Aggregatilinea sp.]HML20396.1 tRNA (adenosine(37)-N6)-threonylcarbamoyltransferase complex ATPase subunit type 1 TsaE [Aggregatilinea sp.]
MSVSAPILLEITTQSVEDTEAIGAALGARLGQGGVICLEGDLGAGKTAFVRGVGRGWGALERVTSPTFTLVHEHRRTQDDQVLFHVDCYRLERLSDAWSLGLDEMLHGTDNVVLEWPERVIDLLPEERLWIAFDIVSESSRVLRVSASGAQYAALVEALRDGAAD